MNPAARQLPAFRASGGGDRSSLEQDVPDATARTRVIDGIGHGITELSLKAEKKRMAKRVIVDENVGRNTALWHEFQRVLGGQPWEYVFLSEAHPGIPDVEILDKLLQPSTVLLTVGLCAARASYPAGNSFLHVGSTRATDAETTTRSDGIQVSGAKRPHRSARRLSPQGGPEAGETTDSLARTLSRLLQSVSCLTLHHCVKGRFFDSMQRKLDQLDRTGSNEVTRVDFAQLAGRLLTDDAEGPESNLTDS